MLFRSSCPAAKGLHSETARALAEALPRILPFTEADADTRAVFLSLLQGPQPVEVDVPVHPRGESLPQVARASLTFAVAAPSTLAPSADDTDAVALVPEVTAGAGAGDGLTARGVAA